MPALMRKSSYSSLSLLFFALTLGSCQKSGSSLKEGGEQGASGISSDQIKAVFEQKPVDPLTIEQAEGAGSSGGGTCQSEEEPDINVILPQCGIPDFSNNDAKTFNTGLTETYTRVIDAGFAVAKVDITSNLTLFGTLKQTTLDVGVSYANSTSPTAIYNGGSDKDSIDLRAEGLTKSFKGPVTNFTVANQSNYARDWKGVICTIRASDKLENKRSGFVTKVSFDPPVAPAVSPIADPARYQKELGDFKVFRNIKATVTETNNPLLKVGQVIEGSIFVEKVQAERSTRLGPFKGDIAYRVTNRFGSKEETLALGFHLWTEYYIDHGQRAFSAIITDVGDEDMRYFKGSYVGLENRKVTVSYSRDIAPLIQQNCVSCHKPGLKATDRPHTDLSSYALVKEASEKYGLIGRVLGGVGATGSMPPSGPLAGDIKQKFFEWSTGGMPDN